MPPPRPASWQYLRIYSPGGTFRHVGYLRHQQQVDLWPFDLESGVRVTYANFSLRKLDLGQIYATDRRQTSDRQTSDSIIALCPRLLGAGHKNMGYAFSLTLNGQLGVWQIVLRQVLSNVIYWRLKNGYFALWFLLLNWCDWKYRTGKRRTKQQDLKNDRPSEKHRAPTACLPVLSYSRCTRHLLLVHFQRPAALKCVHRMVHIRICEKKSMTFAVITFTGI